LRVRSAGHTCHQHHAYASQRARIMRERGS
jgi:hypothetical protein